MLKDKQMCFIKKKADYFFFFQLFILNLRKHRMKDKKKYNSDVATICWDNRGFFLFEMKNTNAEYGAQETVNQFDYFITESEGKPYKVVVDTNKSLILPNNDSFEYFFKHNKEKNKIAVVATQLPMQLIMKFMYKYKNVKNTKLFRCREEAINWITND